MKVYELDNGARFFVSGMPIVYELLEVFTTRVLVREAEPHLHTFRTAEGEEIEIRFRPKPFSIARDTLVEKTP